jgi:hypothetical protein
LKTVTSETQNPLESEAKLHARTIQLWPKKTYKLFIIC